MKYGSVPICDECWRKQEGDREPVRFTEPDQEQCYSCGMPTLSGIYARRALEPKEVPPRSDEKCQYCGGDTDMGYGMAGGGMGAYRFCTQCGRMTDKWQDPEMEHKP